MGGIACLKTGFAPYMRSSTSPRHRQGSMFFIYRIAENELSKASSFVANSAPELCSPNNQARRA
jgi:hypothetical protein